MEPAHQDKMAGLTKEDQNINNTTEDISNQASGHKANISNPTTTNAPPPLAIGSQRNKQNLTTAQKLQHSLPAMSAPTPSRPEGGRRTSTMHKRASILPKHPALFTDPTCLIAQHAGFTGTQPITVGPNVVLHPHAKVSSTLAPVVLGEGVVLWERAKVGVGMGESMNDSRRNSEASRANSVRDSSRGEGTVLGRNVTVEATAVVEAAEVGEGTVIEVGAYLGKGCVIGKHCTIVAHCVIPANTQIPDYMVVQSATEYRVNKTLLLKPEVLEMRTNFHTMQIQTFKSLPHFKVK
ncbi:hypothetical protein GRF29_44g2097387 [Pseudopithomyces chartarum]|uniref:Dynactin subunit 6 n=1 Tax=Pseudopithomyces chartarum TaxID=1892770 RepID=A0AAN6RIT2_9PLEO|nr:hypothetical protein GRF29_44g2097387 [Pseudopithomyces chartarum]